MVSKKGVSTGDKPMSSVRRALTLLDCFDRNTLRLSLADLAKKTGYYKSTILRLTADLQNFGYLQRDDQGRFLLGSTPLRLGDLYRSGLSSGLIIKACLQVVAERTGESTAFYIREEDSRICLYRHHSQHLLRTHVEIGDKVPLSVGGSACRVICAFSSDSNADLDDIREKGYSSSVGERTPDVASVSLPVFLGDGNFAGALVISGASGRFDEEARQEALAIAREEIVKYGLCCFA